MLLDLYALVWPEPVDEPYESPEIGAGSGWDAGTGFVYNDGALAPTWKYSTTTNPGSVTTSTVANGATGFLKGYFFDGGAAVSSSATHAGCGFRITQHAGSVNVSVQARSASSRFTSGIGCGTTSMLDFDELLFIAGGIR